MTQVTESSPRLLEHFQSLEDPMAKNLLEHKLLDVIGLTICAVICGADTWIDIEEYGKSKKEWLSGHAKLITYSDPKSFIPSLCKDELNNIVSLLGSAR